MEKKPTKKLSRILLLSPPTNPHKKLPIPNLQKRCNSNAFFPTLQSVNSTKLIPTSMNSIITVTSPPKTFRKKHSRTLLHNPSSNKDNDNPLLTISEQLHADIMKITNQASQILKEIKISKKEPLFLSPPNLQFKTLNKTKSNFNSSRNRIIKKEIFPISLTSIPNKSNLNTIDTELKSKSKRKSKPKKHNNDNNNNSDSSCSSLSSSGESESNEEHKTIPLRLNRFSYTLEQIKQKHKYNDSIPIYFKSSISHKQLTDEYKFNYISDRLSIILDNLSYFRGKYASNHLLKESFFNLNKTLQIKCNKDFELLAYLCLEIPKLILGNFFFSLDQFLYCKIPNISEYTNILYSNEVEIFSNNIKLICEIFIYLSSCKEVFELLVKKVEQMNITSKLFKVIEQYLHFTRYYSSRIINMSQAYIEKTIQDKNFLIKIEEETQLIPKTKKQHIDILSKIHDKNINKKNLETRKITRVDIALKGNKVVTRGKEKFVLETPPLALQSMLNSNIVSKLLKYVNKSTYDKIIAQRIVDRYKQRNDDQVLS